MLASLTLIVLGAMGPLSLLPAHVSLDYGEGWNAYWTAAAMRSPHDLYPGVHGLIANNYPPLSFYVTGLISRLVGDEIVAGRIIALASLLSVAGLSGWIVFQLARSVTWSLASGLLILLYALYPFGQFFASNNPQWLGQALMLWGAALLVGAEGPLPGRWSCLGSAALMVIAGLVKHNQIAMPIAIACWLLIRDRNLFKLWCVALVAWGLAACLAVQLIYGSAIFAEVLGFRRTYTLHNFLGGLAGIACLLPMSAFGLFAMWRRPKDPRSLLFGMFASLGLMLGAVQHFGAGVGENAYYDAFIGEGILCCALLGSAATRGVDGFPGPWARAALFAVLLTPIIVVAPEKLTASLAEARDVRLAQAQWSAMISDVRQARGPVLCEVLAVCFWANKPMALDFFAFGQKLRTGADAGPLRTFITRKAASLMILDRHFALHAKGETRLPAPFPQLMRENYKLTRTAPPGVDEFEPR
jgi:hypothetical protein